MALWEAADGSPWLVGVHLSSMALLTLVSLLIGKETKDIDLDEGEAPAGVGQESRNESAAVAP